MHRINRKISLIVLEIESLFNIVIFYSFETHIDKLLESLESKKEPYKAIQCFKFAKKIHNEKVDFRFSSNQFDRF